MVLVMETPKNKEFITWLTTRERGQERTDTIPHRIDSKDVQSTEHHRSRLDGAKTYVHATTKSRKKIARTCTLQPSIDDLNPIVRGKMVR